MTKPAITIALLRYPIYLMADLSSNILNYFLAPIVALFSNSEGRLPNWLDWFQTPDNSLDGDAGWKTEHWQWRYKLPPKLATYVGRVGWMYRNCMYGFAINVLGAKTLPGDMLFCSGDPLVSNRPIHSGTYRRTLYRNGEAIYWQYYFVKQYSETRCIRVNLGWKLWSFVEGEAVNCQFVFAPSITMGISK